MTTLKPCSRNVKTSKSGGLKLTIRGSGSSGNSTTLTDLKTGKSIVLDAGVKPAKKFISDNILAVFLTHRHSDHCCYVSAYAGKPILGSPIEFGKSVTPITNFETLVFGPFEIIALSANHDTEDPLHYFIKCRDMAVFYGCDAVTLPDYYDKYFELADVIMIDANYDSVLMQEDTSYPEDLKLRIVNKGHASTQYIRKRMKKYEYKLVLCHLSMNYNTPELAEEKISNCIAAVDKTRCPTTINILGSEITGNDIKGSRRDVQRKPRVDSRKTVKKSTRTTVK